MVPAALCRWDACCRSPHPDGNSRADTEGGGGGLEGAPRRHIVGSLDSALAAEKRPNPKQKRLALFANLLFFNGEPDRDRTEDGRTGLGCRISPKGRKSWVYMYRFGGKARRMGLGTYPVIGLAKARVTAIDHQVQQPQRCAGWRGHQSRTGDAERRSL